MQFQLQFFKKIRYSQRPNRVLVFFLILPSPLCTEGKASCIMLNSYLCVTPSMFSIRLVAELQSCFSLKSLCSKNRKNTKTFHIQLPSSYYYKLEFWTDYFLCQESQSR